MTLAELEQIQKDRENGIIISRPKIKELLDWAIQLTRHIEGKEVSYGTDTES